jgi:hypothetical protein
MCGVGRSKKRKNGWFPHQASIPRGNENDDFQVPGSTCTEVRTFLNYSRLGAGTVYLYCQTVYCVLCALSALMSDCVTVSCLPAVSLCTYRVQRGTYLLTYFTVYCVVVYR